MTLALKAENMIRLAVLIQLTDVQYRLIERILLMNVYLMYRPSRFSCGADFLQVSRWYFINGDKSLESGNLLGT